MHHQAHDNRRSDRNILTDLLMTAKQMIGAYGLAERESTIRNCGRRCTGCTEEEQFHAKLFRRCISAADKMLLADTNLAQQIVTLWSAK